MGVASFAYVPLSVVNPKEATALVGKAEKTIEDQKASKTLPAGLLEQYNIQLAALKDNAHPDLEFLGYPGFLTNACKYAFLS